MSVEVPTVPGLPVVGSAVDVARRMLDTQVRAMREIGDVVRFVVGPPGARVVLHSVYDPDGAHRVLAAAAARYRKDNRLYAEMSNAFGDGLLTSQDETWLRQKRFLQPLFTHAQVAEYVPAMAAEARRLVEGWRGRDAVELHGETSRQTLRVVGRVLLGVYPWATHRHPRHWDEPERFDPDRFTPEREAARARYAWFPFGGGPRTCIGAHFALLESLTVLAAVLGGYRLETPDRPIPVVPKITLHPAGPVEARLTAL